MINADHGSEEERGQQGEAARCAAAAKASAMAAGLCLCGAFNAISRQAGDDADSGEFHRFCTARQIAATKATPK